MASATCGACCRYDLALPTFLPLDPLSFQKRTLPRASDNARVSNHQALIDHHIDGHPNYRLNCFINLFVGEVSTFASEVSQAHTASKCHHISTFPAQLTTMESLMPPAHRRQIEGGSAKPTQHQLRLLMTTRRSAVAILLLPLPPRSKQPTTS